MFYTYIKHIYFLFRHKIILVYIYTFYIWKLLQELKIYLEAVCVLKGEIKKKSWKKFFYIIFYKKTLK